MHCLKGSAVLGRSCAKLATNLNGLTVSASAGGLGFHARLG